MNLTPLTSHQQVDTTIIKKIEPLGSTDRYVYDLETENHHFQAGIGQLIVHNSALTFAITGIPVVQHGRDSYGAYALRGKMLNVRDASAKQKLDNKEIAQLKQILGLQEGKVYNDTDTLRYGHICILTDADHDGKHIKGLILNWLESSFPSLLKVPNFVLDFQSPIVKCWKGSQEVLFYTLRDYEEWRKSNNNDQWKIKYYKGLGTSKKEDVQKYFTSINRHLKRFREIDDQDAEKLDLVFSKKRANDRKKWLEQYDPANVLDGSEKIISVSDFIDKDFIEFSMYDNIRSIPSVVDGLKPGQRKILFTALKTKLTNDLKVAQFASKVADMTEYRHGEQSLSETIIGMAQDFVGSNNINLLSPEGQFGTRRLGGKDAAQPRYTYTKLRDITRKIFTADDDGLLDYMEEENKTIEPHFYVPIIPMVLVNGAEGIGSAYSTTVLNYNPKELISLLRQRTESSQRFPDHLTPWYKGFTGQIKNVLEADGSPNLTKWKFVGNVKKSKTANTLEITELPVHMWTDKYKEFLEQKIVTGEVKDYKEYHTEITVHFVVKFSPEFYSTLESSSTVEKELGLFTSTYTSNMMLFSPAGHLKHYKNVGEILEEFFSVRIEFYNKRKQQILENLALEMKWANNRAKFIESIIEGDLIIQKRTKKDIIQDLSRTFDRKDGTYDYLLNMPLHTLTKEKIDETREYTIKLNKRHAEVSTTTVETMYKNDLDDLDKLLLRV